MDCRPVLERRSINAIFSLKSYLPFDVPAGTQRIDVTTSHDQFSLLGIGRNVLDLGIFGPAGHDLGNAEGFRGWSGGARAAGA